MAGVSLSTTTVRLIDQPEYGRVWIDLAPADTPADQRGELLALYAYNGPGVFKPHLYPFCCVKGWSITDDQPADHIHHRSVWFGHDDVDGVNFWTEFGGANQGRIVHAGFDELASGEAAQLVQRNEWRGPDGAVRLHERRTLRFATEDEARVRILDWTSELTPPGDAPVTLGETKEAGMPMVRVADAIIGKRAGIIVDDQGRAGEQDTFGQPTRWIDYAGPLTPDGGVYGIAILDHPDNPHYPSPAFTRAYGPLSLADWTHFRGPYRIEPGEPLVLRTRIIVHPGDAAEARIDERYEAYLAE
ncbi:MAG: PmoA family protein [Phycisphaeraceae bacterium]